MLILRDMIIKDIKVRNFRCFKNLSLDFGERATIVFGKNGTGKTTLIHSLHKTLSFIMYSDKIYVNKSQGSPKRKLLEVRTITNNNPYLRVEGFSRSGDYNNHTDNLIEIEANATLAPEHNINWKMSAFATNNRLRPSEFIDAFREFYKWHKVTDELPVLAYYSDCFPHKEDTKKDKSKKKIGKLRNFGYFDWNGVEGCTKEWISRLENNIFSIRQSKDLIAKLNIAQNENNNEIIAIKTKEVEQLQHENDVIEDCIKRFSQNLLLEDKSSIEVVAIGIHSENHNLCIITKSGKEISFVNLPSGYKRLFSIVLDLAYRSYILSNRQGVSVQGIAIIDEIDLHLHPELEGVIMNRLIEVFPLIQFIVSTHSILVLTSLNTLNNCNRIITLPHIGEQPEYFKDIYGIDANSGLQEIMGVTLNGEELKRLIDQCAYMYSKNLTEQGDRLKEYIASKNLISLQELTKRIEQKINVID